MDREHEIDILRRLLDLHELRRRPLVAGLSCDLPGSGSYFTADLGTVPVLLVRGADGRVRAFLNACRHRGSAVAYGRGEIATTFTCRYHGWSYDQSGKLVGQPLARGAFDGLDGCTSLIELRCAEDCGVIIVSVDPTAQPIDVRAELAGYASELESYGFGSYRLVGEQQATWPFNWKLGLETFLEAYHIFSLHRETLARQLKSAPMISEFSGPHGRGVVMGNKCVDLVGRPPSEWARFERATFVYWLFPNVVLSLPRSGHVELWHFVPADGRPDMSRVSVRFYAAPSAPQADEFWQRLIAFTMSVVDAEDFHQQTLIQRNVSSGLLSETVFGRNEPAMIHFHEQLDLVLGTSGATVGA